MVFSEYPLSRSSLWIVKVIFLLNGLPPIRGVLSLILSLNIKYEAY